MPAATTHEGAFLGRIRAGLHRLHEQLAARREALFHSDPDLAPIAGEFGLSVGELRRLASRSSHSADELPRMMSALGFDAGETVQRMPILYRDLQRVCSGCRTKARCRRELAHGTAAADFAEFCPNRETLRALRS